MSNNKLKFFAKCTFAGILIIAQQAFAATSVESESLAAHNKLRAYHHAPNLIWNNGLASYAEIYASQCKFQHSNTPYGENLAAGYSTITAAVNAWYAEQENYSYVIN